MRECTNFIAGFSEKDAEKHAKLLNLSEAAYALDCALAAVQRVTPGNLATVAAINAIALARLEISIEIGRLK